MLTIEAFRARHGDALLLHHGTADRPRYALVDGGPRGTWSRSLRPRLQELRGDEALPLAWILLSHVDDDHVCGLIELLDEVDEAGDHPERATAGTAALFHNVPGPAAPPAGVAAGPGPAVDPERAALDEALARAFRSSPRAVVASYPQGAELANLALRQQIRRNPPAGRLLLTGDVLPERVVGPLDVSVVWPSAATVAALIADWEAELGPGGGVDVASVEEKIQNLSSLVVLVEEGRGRRRRRALLTGDALDHDVIAGLRQLDLLDADGRITVDLLKLPHHGSRKNNHEELFATVQADHYVISANGNHGHPNVETLELLVQAGTERPITIWFAEALGGGGAHAEVLAERRATLDRLIAEAGATGTITVEQAGPDDRSVLIEL